MTFSSVALTVLPPACPIAEIRVDSYRWTLERGNKIWDGLWLIDNILDHNKSQLHKAVGKYGKQGFRCHSVFKLQRVSGKHYLFLMC